MELCRQPIHYMRYIIHYMGVETPIPADTNIETLSAANSLHGSCEGEPIIYSPSAPERLVSSTINYSIDGHSLHQQNLTIM